MLLLQPGSRVVLPNIITNEIIQTAPVENDEQTVGTVIGETYAPVGSVMIPYQPGDEEHGAVPSNIKESSHGEDGSKTRFSNTLVGSIASFIKMEKMPMSIDELVLHLTPIFPDLRKMDGTRYKGNIVKAVNGALSSTGIFQRLENGKWVLNEEEYDQYEQRTQKKIDSRSKRKRNGDSHADDEKAKRKYAKRRDRRQTIISLLETISDYQRRSNAERNAIYFKNPFIGITGLENVESLQQKMGRTRFLLCMQMYYMFKDYFRLATGDAQLNYQKVINSGNDFNNKRIVRLKMELEDIRQRIMALEKARNGESMTI
ncbi:hypothetical protein WA538_004790 [Blastocystis sp. DL]